MRVLFTSLLFVLSSWCALSVSGQRCRITDLAGEGVPYVNVYVPSLETGVVSSANGAVRLSPKLAEAAPETPIRLSCIGYADLDTTLSVFRANAETCGVTLRENAYPLAQAEVSTRRYSGKTSTLGFRKDESIVVSSYASDEELDAYVTGGYEVANLMRPKGPWRLRSLGANIEVDTPTVFEFNIYGLGADDQPTERLHSDRIILELPACTTRTHTHTVDVSAYGIEGTGRFLVSVEVVGIGGVDDATPTQELPRASDDEDGIDFYPAFNSKIAVRGKARITRYRKRSGEWKRTPLGVVAGIWCEVER